MVKRIELFIVLASAFFLTACKPSYKRFISDYKFDSRIHVPNYSRPEYWAAHPAKKNNSDSIPFPLRSSYQKDESVDVFFIHPTTFGTKKGGPWNADINDSVIAAKTDYSSILYQASVFNEYRVFAPRYRQANIHVYYATDTVRAEKALDLAYEDIRTAFQYYLEHENKGHAIIIASHSQGSTHAKRLLKEFFDNTPLQSRLVAAYILGMAIPKDYFRKLAPCGDSLQTGCVIGWRSFKDGFEPDFVRKENGNSVVVNPLNWTMTNNYAPKEMNQGAVLTQFNEVRFHVADAQIHDGILWIHKPHFPGSIFFLGKNYHIGDINLFYVNIRENTKSRVNAFLKK